MTRPWACSGASGERGRRDGGGHSRPAPRHPSQAAAAAAGRPLIPSHAAVAPVPACQPAPGPGPAILTVALETPPCRSRGVDGSVSDTWYMTRVFFGCVGPAHTSVTSLDVSYNDPSLTLQSGIVTPVADKSTVAAAE